MHCGEFCGGWCRHDEYGENWDKAVIEVDDVLGLLEGYVAVPQKQLEERRNDLLESYAKERDEFEYGQACMIDEFLDETKALEFRKKLRDDGKRRKK